MVLTVGNFNHIIILAGLKQLLEYPRNNRVHVPQRRQEVFTYSPSYQRAFPAHFIKLVAVIATPPGQVNPVPGAASPTYKDGAPVK
ncbi:hypothetical protein CEXT_332271 [Caerostris extrusa]|uniref:Uncharacterized protein n=1 Tax=Caerostris extrusa TaxID=172846 RepID=A0AAV4RHV5_CAEEX|nr:hypothetical protein CEXT_332271 [Caerostris extrusa]